MGGGRNPTQPTPKEKVRPVNSARKRRRRCSKGAGKKRNAPSLPHPGGGQRHSGNEGGRGGPKTALINTHGANAGAPQSAGLPPNSWAPTRRLGSRSSDAILLSSSPPARLAALRSAPPFKLPFHVTTRLASEWLAPIG